MLDFARSCLSSSSCELIIQRTSTDTFFRPAPRGPVGSSNSIVVQSRSLSVHPRCSILVQSSLTKDLHVLAGAKAIYTTGGRFSLFKMAQTSYSFDHIQRFYR